ncbi:MAG: MlaE family lipid ABC transporter permease subunit [Alphaproteobacteria bacterium]
MAGATDWITTRQSGEMTEVHLSGHWSLKDVGRIEAHTSKIDFPTARPIVLDVGGIDDLDTAGAWLVEKLRRRLSSAEHPASLRNVQPGHSVLLERIRGLAEGPATEPESYSALSTIAERTGRATMDVLAEAADLLNFLGLSTVTAFRTMLRPTRFRLTAFVYHLEQVGLNALPIVGLLSFLIGVVLAYQGADQLRRFGAEIYTVNLLGISMLREMAILLTAIIVAGRSGSAFTAQIGTMQVNEEIDAMRTIGLDPMEVLVLPRAAALLVALPLLAVYADLMGLAGGALMSLFVLDISFTQFTERLRDVVPLWAFWVGLIKAPVFGFVIALIGCREGLKVRGSADSVGRQTTRSVVISIFLVIIIDAVFSIFFSAVGV